MYQPSPTEKTWFCRFKFSPLKTEVGPIGNQSVPDDVPSKGFPADQKSFGSGGNPENPRKKYSSPYICHLSKASIMNLKIYPIYLTRNWVFMNYYSLKTSIIERPVGLTMSGSGLSTLISSPSKCTFQLQWY